MKLLDKIFSIKDKNYNKEIYICGIKIKIKTKFLSLQQEIKLLRTILEKSIDITKVPKATGNFRKVQLIKTQLLKITDIICKKYNLTYWLDFGTLIGAIRHKGFIPWDDDVDVCMLKEDYIKIPEIFEKELADTGLSFIYGSIAGVQLIKFQYKKYYIDIFPMEYTDKRYETTEDKKNFIKKWLKVRQELFKKYKLDDFKNKVINHFDIMPDADKLKKQIIDKNYTQTADTRQLIRSVETMTRTELCAIFETDNIFPLQELEFEDYKFPAPSNPLQHLYESGEYGEYGAVMNFPTITDSGFGHTQTEFENIDYDSILSELKEITIRIEQEQ